MSGLDLPSILAMARERLSDAELRVCLDLLAEEMTRRRMNGHDLSAPEQSAQPVDLVPAEIAARRLTVTGAAVRGWFDRGEVRGERHGRSILVSMDDARMRHSRMRRQPGK